MPFLFRDSLLLFKATSLLDFLTGKFWYPTSVNRQFGLLPLFFGSLIVTAGAILLQYLWELLLPFISLKLRPKGYGCPETFYWDSRRYSFCCIRFLRACHPGSCSSEYIQPAYRTDCSYRFHNARNHGSPTIITISEDAISSVPSTIKQGSLALGATRWQTIYKVIVPAALSGISAAVMLGIGRAIGETMTLMMVTGNTAVIPSFPAAFWTL